VTSPETSAGGPAWPLSEAATRRMQANRAPADTGSVQGTRISPPAPSDSTARTLRVMVVDDHAPFRESLQVLLSTGGFEVVAEAESGTDALRLAAEAKPDVVMMDVRMPGMDGIEATRRLKAEHPDIGVVALTAQEDQSVVRDMLVAGASCYVLKDSDGQEILNAVVQAARGGAVLSPSVTPSVIDELMMALERERRRSRELEDAHRALVERVARRHELIARLGHELRTPVTVILGVAHTLADRQADPEDAAELLETLIGRAQALARLVERFESAADASATEQVDLAGMAGEVAGDGDRVMVAAHPGTPPVAVNPVLARRILEELVDNACRFSPGDSKVMVALEQRFERLEVRVIDQGQGVDPEDRERIFEPLEQAEPLDARHHQGAGVGLSLARAAARAMDGDLVLERSGPEGSTFLWTVPVRLRPAAS
jgi:signal transduction histidine kinase